ncbi:MAG: hypothetical protein PHX72_02750 [Candidatus Shapirobacteria bacterium]|nr:hypothetical protein [Candidatus Shapirobacteria bacterium]
MIKKPIIFRQRLIKKKGTFKIIGNKPLLTAALAWLTSISFFLTIPPHHWWQILIGILLVFASLVFTFRIINERIFLSLMIAGLITLIPGLKILSLLTWPIGTLIILIVFLLVSYSLL